MGEEGIRLPPLAAYHVNADGVVKSEGRPTWRAQAARGTPLGGNNPFCRARFPGIRNLSPGGDWATAQLLMEQRIRAHFLCRRRRARRR